MAYLAGVGVVVTVDLAAGRALSPIRLHVPGRPAGAVLTPDGRTIYVARLRGYVVPVDTATRRAGRPIRIGGVPMDMVMSPDGRTGYVIEPPHGVAVVNFGTNRAAGFVSVRGPVTASLSAGTARPCMPSPTAPRQPDRSPSH